MPSSCSNNRSNSAKVVGSGAAGGGGVALVGEVVELSSRGRKVKLRWGRPSLDAKGDGANVVGAEGGENAVFWVYEDEVCERGLG